MAKRVYELAKELGVSSKVIVEKCQAEGISANVVKNHMSTVSIGLEATVREWFGGAEAESGGAAVATAVETTEKVDLKKARAIPRRARAKRPPAAPPAAPQAPEEPEGETTEAAPPPVRPAPPALAPARPVAQPEAPVAEPETPPGERAPEAERAEPLAPAAEAPEAPEAPPESRDAGQARPAPERTRVVSPGEPAPMNVPTRPKIVQAGPMLGKKQEIRLSGPKVVRVEAPEQVEAPRRRPPPGPGAPPGAAPAGPGDDRNRGRRRGSLTTRRRGGRGDEQQQVGGAGAWRQQDLIEREARLQKAGGYLKKRRQSLARSAQSGERAQTPAQAGGKVKIQAPFTIKDLSAATGIKGAEIVKKLFMQGVAATINSGIDVEKAQELMIDYDIELDVTGAKTAEETVSESFELREAVDERPRGPVVTILGHVDHGKTSLLDRIRNANVASGEAGGITQATSAFRVPVSCGEESKHIVFLDTPGHEAFTAMRARGAHMTDIVVLVVAADDGVMPQTVESINHAKAAGVPIIVALNKIDKPEATPDNIQKIYGQLAEHELSPTEWGGTTEVIKTSALKGEGIQELLDVLDYQSQLLELKADFGGRARGTVIEARPMEGRGAVASVLVQDGELKVGDFIVAGRAFGRVRDITDDRGQKLRIAAPPMPVQISGIDEIPGAGDKFYIVDSLKKAQEAAEQRRERDRQEQLAQPKVTLDSLFSQMAEAELKEILVVLKADVQGSVDVLRSEIEKVSTDEIKVRVLHAAVGGITESDVLLADASRAIIIGFNVIASGKARQLGDNKGVEIRNYDVIYHITDDLRKAAEGLLEPELRQEVLGHAEVRKVFKVSRVGAIAGCYVTDGTVERDAMVRVTRQDIVVENDRRLEQLKRFKDDAKEVRAGMECGMKIVGYDDIKEGDIIECYKNVEVRRTL